MKSLILAGLLLVLPFTSAPARTVRVKGGYTRNWKYRAPHVRTSPNRKKSDNWSTKGNTNPYTGKKGTKAP